MTHTLLVSRRVASPAPARLCSVSTPEIGSKLAILATTWAGISVIPKQRAGKAGTPIAYPTGDGRAFLRTGLRTWTAADIIHRANHCGNHFRSGSFKAIG